MSSRNVIDFLHRVAEQRHILDSLKVKPKDEVIAAAKVLRFPFNESEFDALVWDLETHLAQKRGEAFDATFSLWQMMWGQYYLEYLVTDLLPSLTEADFTQVISATSVMR